jgi:hypothetical protein
LDLDLQISGLFHVMVVSNEIGAFLGDAGNWEEPGNK